LVSNCDEQRGDVLAVLTGLGEGGARAVGLNSGGCELDVYDVGFSIRAANASGRDGITHVDPVDDLAPGVVKASEECACAEEAAQATVTKGG
jgi:hypothetical protein